MNEEKAREILAEVIQNDNSLDNVSPYIWWNPNKSNHSIHIDGSVTYEQWEAILWWVKNMKVKERGAYIKHHVDVFRGGCGVHGNEGNQAGRF